MAAERRTRRTRRFDDDGWEPSSPPSLLGLAHDPDLARDPDRWSPIPGRSTPTTV